MLHYCKQKSSKFPSSSPNPRNAEEWDTERDRFGRAGIELRPLLLSLPISPLQQGQQLEFGVGGAGMSLHRCTHTCSTRWRCLMGPSCPAQIWANLSKFSPSLFIKYLFIYTPGKGVRCKFTTNSSNKQNSPLGTSPIFLDVAPWTMAGFYSRYIKSLILFLQEKNGVSSQLQRAEMGKNFPKMMMNTIMNE